MHVSKICFYTVLIINLLVSQFALCQTNTYDSYVAIKANPLDTINLEVVESDTSHNYLDLLSILTCNCFLDRRERVNQLLLDLAEYGFKKDFVIQLLAKRNCSIIELISIDSIFLTKYQNIQSKFADRIEKDTISRLISEMYDLDQTSRRIYRISSDKTHIKTIDSLNLIYIESWLNSNQIESRRIGVKLEEKIYIMMLHNFRYISEEKFHRLSEKLLQLVQQDKFNPIYYANVVDERLRVNKSKEYPRYNFLRTMKVSEEQKSKIQNNRRTINAY